MISGGEKRKRVVTELPPLTMVTRSSARRQSIENQEQPSPRIVAVANTSGKSAVQRATRGAARTAGTGTRGNKSATVTRSSRGRAAHSHSSAMLDKHHDDDVVHEATPSSTMNLRKSGRITRIYGGCMEVDGAELQQPIKRQCVEPTGSVAETVVISQPVISADVDEEGGEEVEDDEEDDDDVPTFEYESKYKDEVDEEEHVGDTYGVDMVSGRNIDAVAESLPVIADLDTTEALTDFDRLFIKALNSGHGPRWPMDKQDDSTTFSILTKPKLASVGLPKLAFPMGSFRSESDSSDNMIDDFVNYESAEALSEGESDSSSSSSSAPSPSSSGASSPIAHTTGGRRNVPICGYRDRNSQILQQQQGAKIPSSRFMAALSLTPPSPVEQVERPSRVNAYYQQALIAATGLNRRSLWSGKAREMVGSSFDESLP